jgi:hypothetical protein
MTQLEALANIGQIVGAIAVVVSLVYLAVQVRQSTQAQRTENFSRALDRVASMQSRLSQDSETSVIFSKGIAQPSKLTPKERMQFTWAMYELFGAFEFMFLASKADAIPEEVWRRWASAVAWWLTFPGAQIWWQVRPIPFTDSFTSYIESLLENNPTDPEATERYQNFVVEGTLKV